MTDAEPCLRCFRVHLTPWGKPSCTAHRSKRDLDGALVPCAGYRIKGMDVCRFHGGGSKRSKAKAARAAEREAERAALEKAVRIFGLPREVDPAVGLIEEYWRTAGLVRQLESMVSRLGAEDVTFGIITETVVTKTLAGVERPEGTADEPAEVERRVVRGAKRHALVSMFNEERDRFAKLGAKITELGLEARRDEYVRAQVDVFAGIVAKLGLSEEQSRKLGTLLRELDGRPRIIEGRVLDA